MCIWPSEFQIFIYIYFIQMVGLCSFVKGVLIWLRFFRFDLWRDMRLREKESEFGRRREEATIGGGGCDDLDLFQREITTP